MDARYEKRDAFLKDWAEYRLNRLPESEEGKYQPMRVLPFYTHDKKIVSHSSDAVGDPTIHIVVIARCNDRFQLFNEEFEPMGPAYDLIEFLGEQCEINFDNETFVKNSPVCSDKAQALRFYQDEIHYFPQETYNSEKRQDDRCYFRKETAAFFKVVNDEKCGIVDIFGKIVVPLKYSVVKCVALSKTESQKYGQIGSDEPISIECPIDLFCGQLEGDSTLKNLIDVYSNVGKLIFKGISKLEPCGVHETAELTNKHSYALIKTRVESFSALTITRVLNNIRLERIYKDYSGSVLDEYAYISYYYEAKATIPLSIVNGSQDASKMIIAYLYRTFSSRLKDIRVLFSNLITPQIEIIEMPISDKKTARGTFDISSDISDLILIEIGYTESKTLTCGELGEIKPPKNKFAKDGSSVRSTTMKAKIPRQKYSINRWISSEEAYSYAKHSKLYEMVREKDSEFFAGYTITDPLDSIDELELRIPTDNCLLRNSLNTIGQLICRCRDNLDDLYTIRTIQEKSVSEIKNKLEDIWLIII